MEKKKYWICLNFTGINPVKVKKLLEVFGNVEEIFKLPEGELKKYRIGERTIEKIKKWEKIPWEREIETAESMGIKIITFEDEEYPPLLKEIPDPPFVLYVKGNLNLNCEYNIAIVGTRNPSIYGLKMAEKFSSELASIGFTIVSGLARGIDTQAHRAALKVDGKTIGVLGSGFLHPYPKENEKLMEEIFENGAVVSEFPLNTLPLRENFPRRNRIISGLSKGVIVVEAGQKSGALITANYAIEQNREVFAIPGQINSLTSSGTHKLLKEGAKLVEDISDIIEEIYPQIEFKKEQKKVKIEVNQEEREILEIIKKEGTHIDEIFSNTDIPPSRVNQILLNLQFKGLIKLLPGKIYQKLLEISN